VLDSGDQFQGTLLSNSDEGESVFRVMNEVGYDAVVPGNHDYDFGPLGWLYDRVTPGITSSNPREVIERLSGIARFPLLSANTYLKASLKSGGRPIALDDQCRPAQETPAQPISFEDGQAPSFLKPYAIFNRAGVRIAVIGIDNHGTSTSTTRENVSDLCFRDETEAYLDVRRKLEGKADLFVLMMHNGNTDKVKEGSEIVRKINRAYPHGVHLAAAGHTHFVHNAEVDGVRVIQDGANGKFYGRVDLYYDPVNRQVKSEETRSAAGILLDSSACDVEKADFACAQLKLPLASLSSIDSIVSEAQTRAAPMAHRVLAKADASVKSHRINESPLGNALADALRAAGNTSVALMNTGGIRAPLPAGEIKYEDLFEVLPFQNQAVILRELSWKKLKEVLLSAAKTCGRYGTLAQSGLRIRYERRCPEQGSDLDPHAKLIHVAMNDGTVLYDAEGAKEVSPEFTISVTTLDFLASGGGGYSALAGVAIESQAGIARELIANVWGEVIPSLRPEIDSRFLNVAK
jgi:5'-nucleotidase